MAISGHNWYSAKRVLAVFDVIAHIAAIHRAQIAPLGFEVGLGADDEEGAVPLEYNIAFMKDLNRMKSHHSVSPADVLPLARALEVMGDPWSFLIMQEAFFRVHHFEGFHKTLKIARNILTDRLARLVQHKVLKKIRYQTNPPRYEYHLTERGLDAYPYALTLMRWGDQWLIKNGEPPVRLYHLPCGSRLKPLPLCGACGRELNDADISIRAGGTRQATSWNRARLRYSMRPRLYASGRGTSVGRALGIIGDRWGFFVLWHAYAGVARFEEFHRILGVARSVLAARLARLTAKGILKRCRYNPRPLRYEYRPTAKGRGLYPALLALYDWGERWFGSSRGHEGHVLHNSCGNPLRVVIACAHCHEKVMPRLVRFEFQASSARKRASRSTASTLSGYQAAPEMR